MTTENIQQPVSFESEFLNQLYQDIVTTVKKLYPDFRTDEWSLIDDIFRTVYPHVKQSFKNGIEAGKRQATQGRPASTDRQTTPESPSSPSDRAKKAVSTAYGRETETQTYR